MLEGCRDGEADSDTDSDSFLSAPQTPAEPIWNYLIWSRPEPESIRPHLRDEVPRSVCVLVQDTHGHVREQCNTGARKWMMLVSEEGVGGAAAATNLH